MKRMIAAFMTMLMCVAVLAGCSGAPEVQTSPETTPVTESETPNTSEQPEPPVAEELDYARLLTEIPEGADLDTIIKLENRNAKHITAMKVIFEEDSFSTYTKAVTKLKKDKTMEAAEAALEARSNLVQTESVEDRFWFIWDGTTMPIVDGESYTEDDIDTSQMFGAGFEPFVIKYLLDDPSSAKGNIIACSGGAFMVWANGAEGYPAAKVFNDLGYNFFLLQRRVSPYSTQDIFMDYSRAIRVLRYNAEKEGYGHTDMIAGLGWSGGGGTLLGSISYQYGDVNPSIFDSDYVPDEIDKISADLDVAMPIYGALIAIDTGEIDLPKLLIEDSGNKNLPAFYLVHGTIDNTVKAQASVDVYEAVKDLVPAKLTLIEGADHGFGVGLPPATGLVPGTETWPLEADLFMQSNYGHSKK